MCNYFANLSKIANFRKIKVFFSHIAQILYKETQRQMLNKYTNTNLYEFYDGKVWKI